MFASAPTRTESGTTLTVPRTPSRKARAMLYTIAIILVILWALGLVSSYTMGGLIHVLLVIALVVIVVNFFSGRRTL
jgi:hypothetical protein